MNKVNYWAAVVSADLFSVLAPFGKACHVLGDSKVTVGTRAVLWRRFGLGCTERRRRGCKCTSKPSTFLKCSVSQHFLGNTRDKSRATGKLVLFRWKILKWKVTSLPTGSHLNSMLSKGTASYSLWYKYFWTECSQCPKNGPHAAFAALPLFRVSNKSHAKFSCLPTYPRSMDIWKWGLHGGEGEYNINNPVCLFASSSSAQVRSLCTAGFQWLVFNEGLISAPCPGDRRPFAEQPL